MGHIPVYNNPLPDRSQSEEVFNANMVQLLAYLTALAPHINTASDEIAALANVTEYSDVTTYNIPDSVIGSDGITYRCTGTDVIGDDPVGSVTGDWVALILTATDVRIHPLPSGLINRGVNGFDASHGTDSDNDLDFAIGACWDGTNTAAISSTAVITKQIDAAWAAGNNAGGNLSASAGVASHVYIAVLMGNGVAGDVDIGFWDTADGTTLAARVAAAGFTYYKKLGFYHLTAAGAWAKFVQTGDYKISTVASENIFSTGVTTGSYVDIPQTGLIVEDLTELIWYGVRDVSEEGSDSGLLYSDDDGISMTGVIGRPAATINDTHEDVWGVMGSMLASYIPYYTGRKFKSRASTVDLLFRGVKFGR